MPMKRRDSFHKWLAATCLGAALIMTSSVSWALPQEQSPKPPYTMDEYNAMKIENAEKDPQAKIKLLDDFTSKYADSALLPLIYTEYYRTYFSMQNYPAVVVYADKLLALGDKVNPDEIAFQTPESVAESVVLVRLAALAARAAAYALGCDASAFQSAEESAKARNAAAQGQQLLRQSPKLLNLSDEEMATMKIIFGKEFVSEEGIADSRLKGGPINCLSPPMGAPQAAPSVQFNNTIQDLMNDLRQTPRVR
jgi:hypothetical protein